MPAIGRVFFPAELIEQAARNGHGMSVAEAIFVLKDFAKQGLVVPVGDGGWSVTEKGADESASFNGFSLGASYAPPLTWERFLDGKGTPEARQQAREDFEQRFKAYMADEPTGEDATDRIQTELAQLNQAAAEKAAA